jgi:TorA maturation chaperone TorD
MKANEKLSTDTTRAAVYKLFAECYYPPGEDTSEHLMELHRGLRILCSPAAEAAGRMQAAWQAGESFEDLSIDHARLFVGPFALLAPPYGSVYLDGERRLMGDSTLAAGECYQEVGLEMAPDFNGTPDHIAVELEFMHFLVVKEFDALAGGNLDRAENFRQKQRAFLERHLGAWVADFSCSVAEQAQTIFYQNLAGATRIFIESEIERCRGGTEALADAHPSA